jgi:AcrR family transcriptional regulator
MFVNKKGRRTTAPPENAPGPGRRVPAQERSRRRVERILEAAAHVFAAEGYDAATMDAIADRASTSIGSIYQFFPNKLAIYNALVRRYQERTRELFDAIVAPPLLDRPWQELLDEAIDALVAFHESEPGFRAVWVGLHLTEQVVSEGEALNRELARTVEAVLARKLSALPAGRRSIVATMLVETMTAMLILSARRPKESKAVVAETKEMLRRYLEPYAGGPSRSSQPARRRVRSGR